VREHAVWMIESGHQRDEPIEPHRLLLLLTFAGLGMAN
jgi:hypothetical protein